MPYGGPDAPEIGRASRSPSMRRNEADFDATIGIHPTAAEEFPTMRSNAPSQLGTPRLHPGCIRHRPSSPTKSHQALFCATSVFGYVARMIVAPAPSRWWLGRIWASAPSSARAPPATTTIAGAPAFVDDAHKTYAISRSISPEFLDPETRTRFHLTPAHLSASTTPRSRITRYGAYRVRRQRPVTPASQ